MDLYAEDAVAYPPGLPPARGKAAIRSVLEYLLKTYDRAIAGESEVLGQSSPKDVGCQITRFYMFRGAVRFPGTFFTCFREIQGQKITYRSIWNFDVDTC